MNLWQVHVHNNVCGSVDAFELCLVEREKEGTQMEIPENDRVHVSSHNYGTSIQFMGQRGQVFRMQSGYKVERAAQHL
jgi:hypothetical protein